MWSWVEKVFFLLLLFFKKKTINGSEEIETKKIYVAP